MSSYNNKFPSLEEAQRYLREQENKQATLRDLLAAGEHYIIHYQNLIRFVCSKNFFEKYGEWDWIVRQNYIDLIKSLAYPNPPDPQEFGYAFELYNYIPNTISYTPSIYVFDSCTVCVPPEHIEKCKISPKILEAFQLLKYVPGSDVFKGGILGFGIDRKSRAWGSIASAKTGIPPPGTFDYEGYKWHLEGVPPPETNDFK